MPSSASRIAGVYELGHVLHVLDAMTHGFGPDDIARIECFWTAGDMHDSHAGFIFRLADGRRTHAVFQHWHAFEQEEDFRVDIAFLPDDAGLPETGEEEPWSFETAHLARRLAARS